MDTKTKVTKQGVRDLNHYGPKRIKPAPAETPVDAGVVAEIAIVAISETKLEAPPPAVV